MKKKGLKLVVSALVVSMIGGALVGCGGTEETTGQSGSITISGSSALLPLMESSIESFKEKNSDAEISAQAGGSGTGLTQVLEGTVNIGNSDIFADEKLDAEKAKELVDHKVVAQGFALAINKSLGIESLTKQQIKDIFSGKITNWSEVGGPNKEIFLVHRPASSGTRATFTKTILDGDKNLENDSIGATQDSNGAVLKAIQANDGAISYVGLAYLKQDEAKEILQPVKIDGVSSDKENICDGSYPFWSWGHMYTKGQPDELSKSFIEFIMSEENKANLEKLEFISGSEMKVK